MSQFRKYLAVSIAGLQILYSTSTYAFADSNTVECSSGNKAAICQNKTSRQKIRDKSSETSGNNNESVNSGNNTNQSSQPQYTYTTVNQGNGIKVTYANENHNIMSCETIGGRRGTFKFTNMTVDENGIPIDHGGGRHNPSSASCIPDDTRTLTSADSPGPTGPTYEEVMEEIRHAAESLEPGKPTLHQSYNNPAGTGRAEGDPNVYKGDQVNFYVDDGGPYRLEADMLAGHVEIELMPSSYVIEYGNGDQATNYTAGRPVTTYPRERPRQTDTSYAYQRSGNFHAYATVHYTARFRVDGGPWQMMMVTPQATSDPLLVRVWWVDVGRVAGDCSYDDTRWGCKNDPTMGKKDNPNPRLRKADIRTGQRWHLNDNGDGDTEYSLHRDWPDM